MCGIAGIINTRGQYSPAELSAMATTMRDQMSHRGPDDAGLWISPDGLACLAHRRLSIIDTRAEGRQPMLNEDGSVAVTFNGEIYNFPELTKSLVAEGHRFATRTDTEVLCHLFEGDPLDAIGKLQGMFGLAVWRSARRELILARDPFGKKPLYYASSRDLLAFASEVSALRVLPGLCRDIDPVAIQEYLLLQYVHAPRAIYRGAQKLEPGSLARFCVDGSAPRVRTTRYFRFDACEPKRVVSATYRSEDEAVDELGRRLTEAVRRRLVADVPLGAFLSGGNDSSLVVAIMARELGTPVQTFSIGFDGHAGSEHVAAREIAKILATSHHERMVEPSALDLLPTIAESLDEPNGDSSLLPVYLLSEFARRSVTVALSGDGGDEMFGGYGRYGDTLAESGWRTRWRHYRRHRRWWSAGHAYLSDRVLLMPEAVLEPLVGSLDPRVTAMLGQWRKRLNRWSGPLIHRLRSLDSRTYLPGAVLAKVDRMSMRFALEVRCPMLDVSLANWAASLPAHVCHDGVTPKRLLKRLAERYMPKEIVHRPKMGFGLPDQEWSQQRLIDLAHETLIGQDAKLGDLLDRAALRRLVEGQRQPECFSMYRLWGLLVLEHWLRRNAAPAILESLPTPEMGGAAA